MIIMLTTVNKRRQEKVLTGTGQAPTVPTVADHTQPGWLFTDIYIGEICVNSADGLVWTRDSSGIVGPFVKLSSNTSTQWSNLNPTPKKGELCIEYGDLDPTLIISIRIGNNIQAWADLAPIPYALAADLQNVIDYIISDAIPTLADHATRLAALEKGTLTIASDPTPAINFDTHDVLVITAQNEDITGITVSGTPAQWDMLVVSITATGSFNITFSSQFESGSISLPTTIGTSTKELLFRYNSLTNKFKIIAIA